MEDKRVYSVEEMIKMAQENPKVLTESLINKKAQLKAEIESNKKEIDKLEQSLEQTLKDNNDEDSLKIKNLLETVKQAKTSEELDSIKVLIDKFTEDTIKELEKVFEENEFLRTL